ncbi:MAG: hypothetical protein CVT83_04290 [Alphaproteobacteria bacterium HGW-Alphaproteobacteria-5]|nr:MAG: hypothetical protein CVT83_04290 [Alphaproteobacteria bacterium HGW-Alphaproteobacteria-5]
MALAGVCRGTISAQIGFGDRNALFTLSGGIFYWIFALGLAVIIGAILVALETWRPWRTEWTKTSTAISVALAATVPLWIVMRPQRPDARREPGDCQLKF